MLSTGLVFSLFIELVGFILWIKFVRDGQNKYKDITSAFMFLVALFILYQVFKLNLDFGLVLASATLFAAFAWTLGKAINLEELRKESKSYFFILLVITCIRSFAYEPYQIPSRSMVPGLQVGDFVLVNKYAYGLKFPGTHFLLNTFNSPQRNDVAVFIPPHTLCSTKAIEARPDLANLSLAESQLFLKKFSNLQESRCTPGGVKFVKRVIGVPGDKVEIKGYEIWINGNKIDQKLLSSNSEENLIEETLNQGIHVIRTLGLSDYAQHKWEVPNGSYLAIGDNRDNSLDSRAWGYFSEDYLVGKADFIWMNWSSYSSLPTFSRNSRIQ
jgi:signal peptidase I